MSVWYGAKATWVAEGMPHTTKIPCKPEGQGAEMKALADGQTILLILLDTMKVEEHQRCKIITFVGEMHVAEVVLN